MPIRVLFVCLGNICRSPMAEAVFRHLVAKAGLADRFEIDSAGTGDWHIGSRPHPSTRQELERQGIAVGDQRARQVEPDDHATFDYIVAMDSDNLDDLRAIFRRAGDAHAQLSLLLEHARLDDANVPDPYHVGGYDRVYELVDAGCRALLQHICEREGIEAPRTA